MEAMPENRFEILLKKYKKLCSKFEQAPCSMITNQIENAIKSNVNHIECINLNTSGMSDDNKLHDKDIVPFLEAVKHSENQDLIHGIDISWNRINDIGAKCIADYLTSNSHLIELNVQGNDITSKGASLICQSLIKLTENDNNDNNDKNDKSTTDTNDTNNISHDNDQTNDKKTDATSCNLEKLNFNCNDIGDNAIMLLSQYLVQTTKLKELNIGNCDFTHKGWMYIMINLLNNKQSSLKVLNIENCRILTLSHEMHVVLSKLLNSSNSQIENINLSRQGKGIADDGIKWMTKYFNNKNIKTINLSCNCISCDGIKYLSDLLCSNNNNNNNNDCCIETLILQANELTDLSCQYICQIILQSKSIKYIDCRACHFTDEGLNLIAKTMDNIANQVLMSQSSSNNDDNNNNTNNNNDDKINLIETLLLNKNEFGYESSISWQQAIAKIKKIEQNNQNYKFEFDFWPLIQT